jgi:hypothetical protein
MEGGGLPIMSDEQVNLKCVFCGLPVPAKRIDALHSEILGVRVEDMPGFFCSEACHMLSQTYFKPRIERKKVRS